MRKLARARLASTHVAAAGLSLIDVLVESDQDRAGKLDCTKERAPPRASHAGCGGLDRLGRALPWPHGEVRRARPLWRGPTGCACLVCHKRPSPDSAAGQAGPGLSGVAWRGRSKWHCMAWPAQVSRLGALRLAFGALKIRIWEQVTSIGFLQRVHLQPDPDPVEVTCLEAPKMR